MIHRTALTTSALAVSAALILSGCTGDDAPESEESTAAETAAAEDEETQDADGADQTAYGELVEGFPEVIKPLEEGEIVSSTFSPAADTAADEEKPDEENPDEQSEAADDEEAEGDEKSEDDGAAGERVSVSLVQQSPQSAEDILKFYTDSLKDAGFETVGDAEKHEDTVTQAFHNTDNDQTLSLTVGPSPDGEGDTQQVTIGGVVAR